MGGAQTHMPVISTLLGQEECQTSGADLFWRAGQIILYVCLCDKGVFCASWVCFNTCSAGKDSSSFFLAFSFSFIGVHLYVCAHLCVCVCVCVFALTAKRGSYPHAISC